MSIKSFGDVRTRLLFCAQAVPDFPPEQRKAATRKIQRVDVAAVLDDLRVPPGNHLEKLKGDLHGWYSIRINKQWRVIFRWDDGAHQVKVVDYHE